MELREALAQIQTIHDRVATVQTFRGYRASTVAVSGILALVAAAVQSHWLSQQVSDPVAYVRYWVMVAAISVTVILTELLLRTFTEPSVLQREKATRAAKQFLPCVAAGMLLTWALVQAGQDSLRLLPGLWSIVFSLGVFASLAPLPRPMMIVGVHYLFAGVICILLAKNEQAFAPWTMAVTFGVGQLLTAAILYWTQERTHGCR